MRYTKTRDPNINLDTIQKTFDGTFSESPRYLVRAQIEQIDKAIVTGTNALGHREEDSEGGMNCICVQKKI